MSSGLSGVVAPVAIAPLQRYIFRVRFAWVLLLLSGCQLAGIDRSGHNDGFDEPLKKVVIDLGPSPYYRPTQHVRKELTCYYYSSFTVKQYDEGQKGAEWLSITPGHAGCKQQHLKNERVFVAPEWSGYFWGAKGGYAVFVAADGEDGGVPFAVFDVKTGRKLFEDSSLLEYYRKKLHLDNVFLVASGPDKIIRLSYFRVVRAGCNLKKEDQGCWNKVKAEFDIAQANPPVCSEYEQADWESALVYRVSVLLTRSPQIRTANGPVFCWPTD